MRLRDCLLTQTHTGCEPDGGVAIHLPGPDVGCLELRADELERLLTLARGNYETVDDPCPSCGCRLAADRGDLVCLACTGTACDPTT